MRRLNLILGTLLALGCSGKSIDVGPGGTADGSSPGAGGAGTGGTSAGSWNPSTPGDCTDQTPLPSWPDDSQCLAQSDLPLVGKWQGYVENQMAPWDQLILDIKGASVAGGICGTLTLGSAPLPPAATDPNVGYPPNRFESYAYSNIGGAPNTSFASYQLTLLQGTTDGQRVRFSIAQREAFRGWCKLQTSYRRRDSTVNICTCLPVPWSYSSSGSAVDGACTVGDGADRLTANCGKLALCLDSVCACNASGCDAPNYAAVSFDLRFTGDNAVGSKVEDALSPFPTDFNRAD